MNEDYELWLFSNGKEVSRQNLITFFVSFPEVTVIQKLTIKTTLLYREVRTSVDRSNGDFTMHC